MINASIFLDPQFRIADVNRRTFGSFVEHLGRCVYTGIYEPGHPETDPYGLRRDVLDLTRELGVTTVRYPGGNYVSNFAWEDGVGPVSERPRRLDLAWHSIETNEFGLDEFIRWTRAAGAEPMMALNLGTRGVREAVELLEYCNHPGGTRLSDLRRSHGARDPYGIRLWCLGNEMDGPWQIGHKTAQEYGRLAAETAKAMRLVDPTLELVACGSSHAQMPTFGQREACVLEQAYEQVDYISCHAYYEERDGDLASFLASAVDMDGFIDSVVATADAVKARTRSTKQINISFDEWNVWYNDSFEESGGRRDWAVAPRLIGDVPAVDAVVTNDEETSSLAVFAVNRHLGESVELSLDLRAFPGYQIEEHAVLADDDVRATNTRQNPGRVAPSVVGATPRDDHCATVILPPVSWSVVRLKARASSG